MRARWALAGVAAALVLVVGAVVVLWPGGTTEVSEQDAVVDFRERSGSVEAGDVDPAGAEPSADTSPRQAATPEPGVYTYEAEGQEEVKLGPLPAETRPLPATVTAVVVHAGDGCFDWTLNLFVEHTEDTRWCAGEEELALDSHVKHQRIGPMSPTASVDCDPDVVRSADGTPLELTCTLDLSGGPASISAVLTGTTETGPAETLTVDGEQVEAVPVTIAFDVAGDLTGSWTETTWWNAHHLPVRIERQLDLSGLATFSERSTLELAALEPTR